MKTVVTILLSFFIPVLLQAQQSELLRVLVGNEGNFGSSNATLTAYDPGMEASTDGVFLAQNGVGLGDIVQSVHLFNEELFVVVNNSQRIVVADPETYAQRGLISFPSGASPREIGFISETKAYVTDLFANAIYVVDPAGRTVRSQTIPVGTNPDRILIHENYAYVANNGFGADSTIFRIDTSTDEVVDTLLVGRGPAGMQITENGLLWVICTGYAGDFDDDFNLIPGTSQPGGLFGIDLNDLDADPISVQLESAGADLLLGRDESFLYVNSGGVRAFDVTSESFAEDTLLQGSFYAMGYDEAEDELYLANAGDFASAGEVIIATTNGTRQGSFDAGIIPGSFLFVYNEVVNSTEEDDRAYGFALEQNYPNPFNPSTTIRFRLGQPGAVRLSVYSVTGELVKEVYSGGLPAGSHGYRVDMSEFSSGVYFYNLLTDNGNLTKKMVLLK